MQRKARGGTKKKRSKSNSRSGAAWPDGTPPATSTIGLRAIAAIVELRNELGREPTEGELCERLGVPDIKAILSSVRGIALPYKLTPRQHQCLRVVERLEQQLGRSPSTREVSEAMGLGPSGSRFHLKTLVKWGLVTPPEVRLVLSVTEAGRAYLKPTR